MLSSTKIPIAIIKPITEIWFKSTPSAGIGMSPIRTEARTVSATANAPYSVSPAVVTTKTASTAINSET